MGEFADDHPITHSLLNLLLTVFLTILFTGLWLFGWGMISFTSIHPAVYIPFWTLFCLGLFLLTLGLTWKQKIVSRIACVLIGLPLLICGSYKAWNWWTYERHPVIEQKVDYWRYQPYRTNNRLVQISLPEAYAITDGDYPRLNGAYALYPVYAGMAQAMYPKAITDQSTYLSTDGSDVIYEELLHGLRDVIFALAPSRLQAEAAAKAGITYELTPFCSDAFVFYVNVENPVNNLTTAQIKDIYSGRITDWKDVGAPESTRIMAFQRNEGSGSQTTLQKLMGDIPIMPPLKEDRASGMGDIINDTANYRNHNAALGFSFRYYAMELLRHNKIKLLSIDGVAPTIETIRNGTYPLITRAYVVTAKPRTVNMQKISDFMRSPEGQELVEKTGYVPSLNL